MSASTSLARGRATTPAANVMEWKRAILSPRGPEPTTRLVLLAMAHRMDTDGSNCFIGIRGLAKLVGLNKDTVAKHRDRAVRDGWVIPPANMHAPKAEWRPAMPSVELSEATGQLKAKELSGFAARAVRHDGPSCPKPQAELSEALGPTSFLPPSDSPSNKEGTQEVWRGKTIATLDLGIDAIRLCQKARPGADPLDVLRKFRLWGQGRPANDWQRSLQTFAINERLSDDEMRAEQRAIYNKTGPRKPGESAAEYVRRTADPPTDPKVANLISEARL